jgi:hypothetical protein
MAVFSAMLFDKDQPQSHLPRRYTEPAYSFLNRSSQPRFREARTMLESWLHRYPAPHRPEIISRFRSLDDFHHRSAFFELLLHEALLCLGCSVAVHRANVALRKVPDFLATSGERKCCIEAAVVTGESLQARACRNRINTVYDILNELDSPYFFVGVKLRGAPATPPPARAILAFLRQRLEDLDLGAIQNSLEKSDGLDGSPHWPYAHDGWKIEFFPIPKPPKLRGQPGVRPLSIFMPEVTLDTSRQSLQNSLEKKAGRYGAHQMPYVIAVNATSGLLEHDDVVDALLGSDTDTVTQTLEGYRVRNTRLPNGLWRSQSGPRYKRVSAVLIFFCALPWTLASTAVRIYLNPWADRPYDGELTTFGQCVVRENRLVLNPGVSLGDILSRGPSAR